MGKLAIFGSGKVGLYAAVQLDYIQCKADVVIDNNSAKWGEMLYGIPIVGMEEFKRLNLLEHYKVIIACVKTDEIKKQLNEEGITDYVTWWDYVQGEAERESVYSYSAPDQMEDVILYHVLHQVNDIFYIDVGSNDPVMHSVTKWMYEQGAHGMNIEPQRELADKAEILRKRDINLCVGVDQKPGVLKFYKQAELTTSVIENRHMDCEEIEVEVLPLRDICNQYLAEDTQIHFLKIDVEGMEKRVLLGADFSKYRPWIVVMESTLPGTDVPCYEEWEDILTGQGYHYAYSYGVNRYYVADERRELDERFIGKEQLKQLYNIYYMVPLLAI